MIICKSRHVAASDSIFYWRLSNIPVCVCMYVYVCAKWLQLCLTVCSPMDCRPPGPLSMGFSRQEHWSGLPCSPPGDLPHPGIEPRSPVLKADPLASEPPGRESLEGTNVPSAGILCCFICPMHISLGPPVMRPFSHLPLVSGARVGKVLSPGLGPLV